MQLLRKITARSVFGSKADILRLVMSDEAKEFTIYRIVGVCTGSRKGGGDEDIERNEQKPGQAPRVNYGPWEAMLGAFQATNAATGEVFRSGICFLPQFAADIVLGQLTGDVENVAFAYDITVKYDEASATSYVYGATSLMKVAEDDRLNALEGSLRDVPALAPPVTQKKIAAK